MNNTDHTPDARTSKGKTMKKLTPAALATLNTLTTVGSVSALNVSVLIKVSVAATRTRLKKLVELGLVHTGRAYVAGTMTNVFSITDAGREATVVKPPHVPSVALAYFDRIVINTSAGKDSQVMLDIIVKQAREQGVEDRLVAVHADLGRVEWDETLELAKEQAEHYGVRFMSADRPEGDLLDHVEERGKWMSRDCRYCTSDHKRGQIMKVLTVLKEEVLAELDEVRPVRILNCIGIRAQESTARAEDKALIIDKRQTGKGEAKLVVRWYPIFDWTENAVWKHIDSIETRHHYAYDLGMPRLSCCFCVFAPKWALLIAGRENPELLADYVRVEKKIGHDFRLGFKIEEIQAALNEGVSVGTEDVKNWDM